MYGVWNVSRLAMFAMLILYVAFITRYDSTIAVALSLKLLSRVCELYYCRYLRSVHRGGAHGRGDQLHRGGEGHAGPELRQE